MKKFITMMIAAALVFTTVFSNVAVGHAQDSEPVNVAAGKEVVACSAGSGLEKVTDGNHTTHADIQPGLDGVAYIVIDLGEEKTFDSWKMYNFNDFAGFENYGYSLAVSDSSDIAGEWTVVSEVDNSAYAMETEDAFDAVTARYVRVLFAKDANGNFSHGDSNIRVEEIEIYEAAAEEGFVSVNALAGAPVVAQSSGSGFEKITDGDYTTHADVWPGPDGVAYIVLDLGSEQTIGSWKMHNFNDFPGLENYGYSLAVSDSVDGEWTVVSEVDNSAYESVTEDAFDAVTARYVRVLFEKDANGNFSKGDTNVRVEEIEIFTAEEEEEFVSVNALAGAPVVAQSSGSGFEKITDGDYTTHADVWPGPDGVAYIVLDLGSEQTIGSWKMHNFNDFPGLENYGYSLAVSDSVDGEWTVVSEVDNSAYESVTEDTFDAVTARYVRVLFEKDANGNFSKGDTNVRVEEIEIFTAEAGSGNEGSGNEGSGNEGSGNEGSGNEGSGNEGSGNEGSGNEGSGNGGSGDEGSNDEPQVPVNVLAGMTGLTEANVSAGLNMDKLFDGTNAHADIIPGTDGSCWIRIDLGETYKVNRWTVTNKTFFDDSYDFVPLKYELSVATEMTEGDWATVEWTKVAVIDNAAKKLETEATFEAVDARYILVEFLAGEDGGICTGDNQARVAEMGLYTAVAGSENEGSGNAGTGNEGSGNAGTGNEGSGNAGTGNGEAGKDEAGKDEAGKDEAGKDEAGKDEASKDEASKDEASKDEASKDEASKDEAPKTGDASYTMTYVLIMVAAVAVVFGMKKARR